MTAAGDDPMLGLFRAEAAAAATALADGLAAAAVADRLPALERAAAQVKGAALLVGHPVADVAVALESALAAARAAGAVTADRVADFVAAADLIRAAADGADELDTAGVVARLSSEASGPRERASTAPPVEPPPPPAPARSPDPLPTGLDDTLMELFRQEVRSLTDTLANGLVELEASADPRAIEPLMRAAHSIKGAARIVGCDPAVELAHVMEELLVAAQRGTRTLTPDDIDPLLAAVDLLARLADTDLAAWANESGPAADDCRGRIAARLSGAEASGPRQRAGAAPVNPPPPTPPPPVPPPPDTPNRPAPAGRSPEPDADDRVVRISASSLSRLLSLAGESLVEARWLQPFARSLARLKKYQDHLAASLDELADRGDEEAVADARRRAADCRRVLAERIDEFEAHAGRSDDLNSRLYREVIASRMRPFADGTHGLARMVRDVARQLGKPVRFEVAGTDTDVDRDILDKLEAPLGHMLRNALDHGIESPADRLAAGKHETATLKVEARHQAGMLGLFVSDDGRGIDVERVRRKVVDRKLTSAEMAGRLSDAELLEFLFLPGFSTADAVTDLSGRGVGLDAVQAMAQQVGGSVRVHTRLGRGTTFELTLPITLSVVRAVLVRIGGDPFALPLNRTDRLIRLPLSAVRTLEGKPHFESDGRHVGLVPAHQLLDLPAAPPQGDDLAVVLIGDRSHQYGLVVDGFLGEQDLVVRPLDPRLGKVPNVAAAALLDDGSPVLIADVDDLARSAATLAQEGKLRHQRPTATVRRRKRVLVVDDSAIVREAERQLLQARGYEVELAVDGADGWNAARAGGFDLIVTDIDMPRMTGLELVKAVRGDPKTRSTPVVVVSYKDRDDDRERGLDAGANYYLTKSSFHDGRFLGAVEDLIGGPDDG